VAHLRRALEINPGMYKADLLLAEIYEELGNETDADVYRQKAGTIRQKPSRVTP